MRLTHLAVGVAAALALGAVPASASAAMPAGASASTIYVDNGDSACTDTGTGTAAAPFCTIQAAADAAEPGQTVLVDPGANALNPATWQSYDEDVQITRSGTPGDPITFTVGGAPWFGSDWGDPSWPSVTLSGEGTPVDTGFSLSGAHDIVIRGFGITQTTRTGIAVADSSDVTLDENEIGSNLGSPVPAVGIAVTGASSGVTISRDTIEAGVTAVSIGSGATGTVVTTNAVEQNSGEQVSIGGATDTAVTGNSWDVAACTTVVSVSDSSQTTIENNTIDGDCTGTAAPPPEISVAADSTASTKLDYNMPYRADGSAPYSWGGTSYATAAALNAATGQGAHDINASSTDSGSPYLPISAAAIDSADANAPGELTTDIAGLSRVDDPVVANTGTGPGYYDRGAYEAQDPLSFGTGFGFLNTTSAPVGASVSASFTNVVHPWSDALTETVDFGDGTAAVTAVSGVATHVYTTAGTYTVTATLTDGTGASTSQTQQISIVNPAPLVPKVTLSAGDALSVSVDFTGTSDSYQITGGTFNPGDGTPAQPIGPSPQGLYYTYAKPGTYTLTVTLTDAGGRSATVTAKFTTAGSDFQSVGPVRVLDTRTGTGGSAAKLAAGGVLKLKVGGVDGIPADATAVAVNLTATDTAGSGFVTAYGDGSATPNASNLNYTAGKTVAAAAIVPVGADGEIDLGNSGAQAGSIDLVADVDGYFAPSSGSGYTPLAPDRLLDTRDGTGIGGTAAKIPAKGTVALTIAGADGGSLPAGGVAAVALNLTATDTTGTGFVIAAPDGSTLPNVSNLNYRPGQTVANAVIVPVGADGKIDLYNGGAEAQPIDLVADVTGYFSAASPSAYVPVTPKRLLDTRTTAAIAAHGSFAVDPNAALPSDGADPHNPATAFALNTTVTEPSGSGFITVYPDGTTVPDVSTVNYTPGLTVANLALATPGSASDQKVDFFNGGTQAGTVELIVDLFGYFSTR